MLQPITERTFYLPGANNLGVIATGDGDAIAIDTGLDKNSGRALRKALDAAGLQLRAIINTHHHADHIGGNDYLLRNLPGVSVYAPPLEAALIEHPVLEPVYFNQGARPHMALRNRWLMAPGSPVQHILGDLARIGRGEPQQAEVAGVAIEIIPVPGHSLAQIAVACDGVCFAADGFFGPAVLEKHGIPYAHDVAAQLTSLDRLAARDEHWFLPGHGELVARNVVGDQLSANRAAIERSSAMVLQALEAPGDAVAATARVVRKLYGEVALPGIPQYVVFAGAVAAHLSFLEQQGLAQVSLEADGLIWRRTAT